MKKLIKHYSGIDYFITYMTILLMLVSLITMIVINVYFPDRSCTTSTGFTFGSENLLVFLSWLIGLGVLTVRGNEEILFKRRILITSLSLIFISFLLTFIFVIL